MFALIRLLLGLLTTPFRSKSVLEAENAALRQQVIVLRRKLRGRVKLSNGDRLFFVWVSVTKITSGHRRGGVRLIRAMTRLRLPSEQRGGPVCVPKIQSGLTH